MSDLQSKGRREAKPSDQDAEGGKAALETRPDEARMSEIAKRLLSTPPNRSVAGNVIASKQSEAKGKAR